MMIHLVRLKGAAPFTITAWTVFACFRLMSIATALSNNMRRPGVLVTGSTDGIGVTTAKELASQGYDVLIHGRDAQRIERAHATVQQACIARSTAANRVFALPPSDLSTIEGSRQLVRDVQALCEREPDLNLSVLMNNAGVYAETETITDDGLELTFAVNVVAPFVITSLLLPTLMQQQQSSQMTSSCRIVIASSISQSRTVRNWETVQLQTPFSSHAAYSESKLLVAMLTMELADRLLSKKKTSPSRSSTDSTSTIIQCHCLDPGTVNTKMLLAGWGPCGIAVEDALDQSWLCSATTENVQDTTGRYFVHRTERNAAPAAYDPNERRRLWLVLAKLAPDAAALWED